MQDTEQRKAADDANEGPTQDDLAAADEDRGSKQHHLNRAKQQLNSIDKEQDRNPVVEEEEKTRKAVAAFSRL